MPERRDAARRRIAKERPFFFVGSPMCAAFSIFHRVNVFRRDPDAIRWGYNKVMVSLEFACQLYQDQLDAGRDFLHEHPAMARSWQERCIAAILAVDGVDKSVGD